MKESPSTKECPAAGLNRSWGYGFGFGLIAAATFSFAAESLLPPESPAPLAVSVAKPPDARPAPQAAPAPPASDIDVKPLPAETRKEIADPAPLEDGARSDVADVAPRPDAPLPSVAVEEDAESSTNPGAAASTQEPSAETGHPVATQKKEMKTAREKPSASGHVSDRDINRAVAALFQDYPEPDSKDASDPAENPVTIQSGAKAPPRTTSGYPTKKTEKRPVKGPLAGWSLSALSGDRAVITNVSGDSRVVRAGDVIGSVKILNIDPKAARVETSGGVLAASATQ